MRPKTFHAVNDVLWHDSEHRKPVVNRRGSFERNSSSRTTFAHTENEHIDSQCAKMMSEIKTLKRELSEAKARLKVSARNKRPNVYSGSILSNNTPGFRGRSGECCHGPPVDILCIERNCVVRKLCQRECRGHARISTTV